MDGQKRSENLDRIERALRECRDALADTTTSERASLLARMRTLNRELGLVAESDDEATIDHSTSPREKGDFEVHPTHAMQAADEATHSAAHINQTVSIETRPNFGSHAAAADSPGNQSEATESSLGGYQIIEEIARGGMGVVFKARDVGLNRVVALKVIRAGDLAGEEQVKRFRMEAEAAAKLDHPGIVPVYDVGETAGRHYYSMAFVDGVTLNDLVKNDGPLEPVKAAELIRDTARAVGHAHAAHVIHRDLKPHNVMLDSKGQPKVTDFGLAKLRSSEAEMTATGQILGTPAYMPPEQAMGMTEEVDVTADIYSLGATLYFSLTGRPPFQSAIVTDILRQVVEDDPVAPRALVPTIPRDLETICLKALRKEPSSRYETADDLAADLQRWLNGEPILARRVNRLEKVWKWCKRKPISVGLSMAFALLLVGGAIVFTERQYATYAEGLVERLLTADPQEVDRVLSEIPEYGFWIKDDLQESFANSSEQSREKLHSAIALLAFEDRSLWYLQKELIAVSESDLSYIKVICDSLGANRVSMLAYLWQIMNDEQIDPNAKFRAGLALSYLEGQSGVWSNSSVELLTEELVKSNAVHQSDAWLLLEPINARLLEPLEEIMTDPARTKEEQLAAANAIAAFAEQDEGRLASLLIVADGAEYRVLFEKYKDVANDSTQSKLRTMVQSKPNDDMDVKSRLSLGKARAISAITLLQLGRRNEVLEVFRVKGDPESLTQFVHCLRERGVKPAALIELLHEVDQSRGSFGKERKKIDDSVLYGLLLALGEFTWDELPADRVSLVAKLNEIYEHDPSSSVHSATGWLLQKWEQRETVARVDQTPLPFDPTGHREWFVRQIDYGADGIVGFLSKKKLYLTFVVFQPNELGLDSANTEVSGEEHTTHSSTTPNHPLAVSDRELTWKHWDAFEGLPRRQSYEKVFSKTVTVKDAAFGISWFDAVFFCRWLSAQDGLSEAEQCYEDPGSLAKDSEGNPIDWRLRSDKTGFRLPTQVEWERVCRAGTSTTYSFGNDEQLLDYYAWYLENSGAWLHAPGELRPNLRGLFDTHGNLSEWCHDWDQASDSKVVDDSNNSKLRPHKVFRGGAWSYSAFNCRSLDGNGGVPEDRQSYLGFRIVFDPTEHE